MADDNKDLIFPMHLDLDTTKFQADWTKIEPQLQAILNKNPLKAVIDIDNKQLKNAINQLSKLQTTGLKQSSPAQMLIAETKSRILLENQLIKAKNANAIATDKQRIATANAEKAELALERAKQRGVASVYTQNKAYQAQRGILNGLPQFINSYVSILGAYRLGQNIVDTTAEFEMQRVALAAIIQDKQKADQLFSQNVELGLQSPFQIKELITYTKQLAAFRIETDQLFDTTKRLADVSAGLGVDMGRLILAYGQVRAASVLRGQEVRQFTEAGIPIIQLLADKFTKLNGTATSTADVFKLISERAVSFGMVKEVFEDMTNAGGTFYRMQEIQAQTLKGSLANLTDAYQKMFMEIGNANLGPMKSLINGMRDMMSNWRVIGDVITDVAVGYGVLKLSMWAYNTALGKENASMITSLNAANKKEASLLRMQQRYMALTPQESARIRLGKEISDVQIMELMNADKLSKSAALRLVYLGKTNVAQEQAMISTGKVTQAEIELARGRKLANAQSIAYSQSLSTLINTQNGVKLSTEQLTAGSMQQHRTNTLLLAQSGQLSAAQAKQAIKIGLVTAAEIRGAAATKAYSGSLAGIRRGAIIAATGIQSFAASIWMATKAMLASPYTWVLLGITAIIKGFTAWSEWNKKYKKQTEESAKAMRSFATEMTEAYGEIRGVVEKGLMTGADEKAITSARASLQQIIEKNEELKPLVDERLKKLTTEAEKLKEIKKIWDEIKLATDSGGVTSDMVGANKDTGSWLFNDDFIKNAGDFKDAISGVSSIMGSMRGKEGLSTSDLSKSLKEWQDAFEKGNVSIEQYRDALTQLQKVSTYRASGFSQTSKEFTSWNNLSASLQFAIGDLDKYKKDANDFFDNLKNRITEINGKPIDWGKGPDNMFGLSKENFDELQILLVQSKTSWFSTFDEIQKKGQPIMNSAFNKMFGLPLSSAQSNTSPSNFQKEYNAYIDSLGYGTVERFQFDEKGFLMNPEDLSIDESKRKEELKKKIDENKEALDIINGILANRKDKIDAYTKSLEADRDKLELAIKENEDVWTKFFGGTDKPETKTDPRIALLTDQLKVIEEAYSKFLERSKQVGAEQAKLDVTAMYQPAIKDVGIKGISPLSLAFNQSDLNKAIDIVKQGYGKLGKDAMDELRSVILKQNDSNFDELTRNFKANLDRLANEIEQTQRANEFYEKMLGLTGSEEAASRLTKAMGMTVGSVRESMKKALAGSMNIGGVNYGEDVDLSNVEQVQNAIKKMRDAGIVDAAELAQKQLDILIDYDQKQIEEYLTFNNKISEMQRESPFLGSGAGFDVSKLAVNTSAQIAEQKKIQADGLKKLKELHEVQKLYTEEEYTDEVNKINSIFDIKIANIRTESQEKLRDIANTYVKEKLQGAGLGEEAMSNLGQKSLTQLNSNLQRLKQLQEEIKANKTVLPEDIKQQLDTAGLSLDGFIGEVEKLLNLDISDNIEEKTERIKKSVEDILSSLSQLGSAIEKLGQTTGDTSLSGLGNAVSELSDLVSTVGQDIASGNIPKAAVDVAIKIGTEIIADIQHTEELKNKLREVAREAKKMEIENLIGNEDANTIFGESYWDDVSSIVDAINLAKSRLDDTIASAQSKSSNGKQDWYYGMVRPWLSPYGYLFTNDGNNDTPYSSLGDFTFKSKDRSGFLNALGWKDEFSTISDAAKELGVELYGEDGALNPDALKQIYDTYASEMDSTQKNWFEDAIMYSEEYKAAMEALDESIEDMFGQIAGSVADAFMESYDSIVNTAASIDDVFKDLGNSITKSLIQSFLVEEYLSEYKKKIKDVYADQSKTAEQKGLKLAEIALEMETDLKTNGVPFIQSLLSALKNAGLFTPESNLTGISAASASMTEESANTMGGYLNSGLMQWVQQTGLQQQILAALQMQDVRTPLANMFQLQQQSLAAINSIKSDTAIMVTRLTRLVENNDATLINGGAKAVNVRLIN